jgi:hypothetical protein
MTDILDIVYSLRLQIPQNLGILDMCSSLRGRKKRTCLDSPAFPGIENSSL